MFDIGIEKLLLMSLLIGLIAGPDRLVAWAQNASHYIARARRAFRDGTSRVSAELDEVAPEWRDLDPRKVDPRRIVRDAMAATIEPAPPREAAASAPAASAPATSAPAASRPADPASPLAPAVVAGPTDPTDEQSTTLDGVARSDVAQR